MAWFVENPPHDQAPRRVLMEWLSRSFRKLSDWSRTRVEAGYGGIFLRNPVTLPGGVALTTTFQKLTAFDATVTNTPIGVVQDLNNDRIAVTEPGMWNYQFAAVGEIQSFSNNAAQTIEVAAYNETKNTSIIVGYHPVPRYSDVFDVGLSGLRQLPYQYGFTEPGDFFSLWIRQRAATPLITVNAIQEMEITAFRVSE